MEAYLANLETICQKVDNAATKSGRRSTDVKIIGVTKYVGIEQTRALVNAGCSMLGESRPQLLWEKAEAMADLNVQWHMIGHLQRNKARKTIEYASLIHSVDSQRLAAELDRLAEQRQRPANILLEVNVSGDEAKHGLMPEQLKPMIEFCGSLRHLQVQGVMCMAGLSSNVQETRREFATLRELAQQPMDLPENVEMKELSMGMSGDFELAIEEGATMVRIGSLLFEGIM